MYKTIFDCNHDNMLLIFNNTDVKYFKLNSNFDDGI